MAPALGARPRVGADRSAAIDLLPFVERSRSDGDLIQISTAPGADGIVRRIAIKAKEAGIAARLDRLRAEERHATSS